MRRTTISLPDDLAQLIEEEARRRRASVSEVIRESVTTVLIKSRRKLPFAAICDDQDMVHGAAMEEALEGWADDIARSSRQRTPARRRKSR